MMVKQAYSAGDRIIYAGENGTVTRFRAFWYGNVVDVILDNGVDVSSVNILSLDDVV